MPRQVGGPFATARAWSLEAGWGQAWIPATLALREMKTTFWDFTADSHAHDHFEKLKELMGIEGR